METLSISRVQSWLSWFLRGLLILGFLFLLGRLVELQIIKGGYFRGLAEGNRIRRVPIAAPRGRILARGGEVLVDNKEVKKRVIFDPEEGYEKTTNLTDAKEDEIITEWQRIYKLGDKFAHVSGYLGEVSEEELGKVNPRCPEKGPKKLGSFIGRTGLEEYYECTLSGIDGEELVEVDTSGERVRTLGTRKPIPGEDIKTNIDNQLQIKVSQTLQGKKGAIVAADPNGEILALYSSPSFDPNFFVKGEDSQKIEAILKDENLPMFNRAVGGIFHPGSVFKPVVAVAALEEGEVDERFLFDDPGQIAIETPYGTFTYANWYFTQYGAKEGEINLVRAIARSTDTFFYKLGEFVGIAKLSDWARRFGLGELSGIDITGEVAGLIPTPEWKERVKGEPWFLGNTYHMAIGQGDIALSPLEVNSAISAISGGGKLCKPRVVKDPECRNLDVSSDNLKLVKEGMVGACTEGGTGFPFFDFEPQVGCKTGTAETNEEGKTHAWFSAFAPSDFPEIVVTVLVEKGGEGSEVAGPIAREIFDYYFNR